ncbi:MAG: zinc metallopeptidase [Candidatus Metalachnospira sp.]|nr:zinc metallopeptidase [Candidatus Metalachnospira sp.]
MLMPMFFYFDWTYLVLVLPAIILAMAAQGKVSSTFNKYSRVPSRIGITGAEAARRIMEQNGIYDVSIERVSGNLTDHYDPSKKVLRLSDSVYSSSSIAAVGVAAHETGHAIQHARGYAPLSLRSLMVPLANIGSRLSMPLILLGLIFSFSSRMGDSLITLGIVLFGLSVVFTVITLPVEFNASKRAIACLGDSRILYEDEIEGAKKVLSAAAMTYVASTAVALANFLRLIVVFGGRRRD